MKKMFITLFSAFVLTSAISAHCDETELEILPASELSISDLQDFFNGVLTDIAIQFPAGLELPLSLAVNSEFFTLSKLDENSGEYLVTINRDIFLSMTSSKQLLFSLDGKKWQSFRGLVTGKAGCYFGKDEDGIPFVDAYVNLRERK